MRGLSKKTKEREKREALLLKKTLPLIPNKCKKPKIFRFYLIFFKSTFL